jgi:thioredoxin reductase (NADPH)
MIVRGDSLSALMSQYLVDEINATPNIQVMPNAAVVQAHGDSRLEAITIANSATGETVTVPASYLFIFIGAQPRTEWLAGVVERDTKGFILTGPDLIQDGKPPKGWPLRRLPYWVEASVPGIFAVGDVRYHSSKRVATAVGEGAMAAQFAQQHLSGLGSVPGYFDDQNEV